MDFEFKFKNNSDINLKTISESVFECIEVLKSVGLINLSHFQSASSHHEVELGKQIANLIIQFVEELCYIEREELFGCDEEMAEDEFMESENSEKMDSEPSSESQESSSQPMSSDYEPEEKKVKHAMVPLKKKITIVNLHREHPKWKFATLKVHAGPSLTRMDELSRWKKDIINGGTQFDKSEMIKDSTYSKFCMARQDRIPVTSRNLQEWALQCAQQFKDQPDFMFQASPSWITRFKRDFKIRQRKVTRLVKPTEQKSIEQLLQNAESFQTEIRELTASTSHLDFIINTDQMGCEYRTDIQRTLEHQGQKTVEVHLGDVNKVTHSYTVQYSITALGKLLPKVFICLQEPSGKFGPRIQQEVDDLEEKFKNVVIECSRSGKLSSELVSAYVKSVLQPYVNENKCTLILDSWSGQKKDQLFDCLVNSSGESLCTRKYIPPGCTQYCQPLDTFVHRQMKILIKKMQNSTYLIENQQQINTRQDAIKIHHIVHHQLSAPIFRPMISYAWFSAKLIEDRDVFATVNEVCFSYNKNINCKNCNSVSFIKCSWCRYELCFQCFYILCHSLNCSQHFHNV